jgi:hypothetical protein
MVINVMNSVAKPHPFDAAPAPGRKNYAKIIQNKKS